MDNLGGRLYSCIEGIGAIGFFLLEEVGQGAHLPVYRELFWVVRRDLGSRSKHRRRQNVLNG